LAGSGCGAFVVVVSAFFFGTFFEGFVTECLLDATNLITGVETMTADVKGLWRLTIGSSRIVRETGTHTFASVAFELDEIRDGGIPFFAAAKAWAGLGARGVIFVKGRCSADGKNKDRKALDKMDHGADRSIDTLAVPKI
jgi:hypothetical protein